MSWHYSRALVVEYSEANSAEHCETKGTGRKHMGQPPNAVAHGGTSTRQTYPTPTNSMVSMADMEQARTAGNSPDRPKYSEAGTGGQLNPDWVEWLMGWPIGWTDLKPSGMDKFQQWLDSHGIF